MSALFITLLLSFISFDAFSYWYGDYEKVGGNSVPTIKSSVVFNYSAMKVLDVSREKKEIKIIEDGMFPYPYLKFYSDKELKNVVGETNKTGLYFKNKLICSPRLIRPIAYLCPNTLIKFRKVPHSTNADWYVFIEIDRIVNQDVVETSYNDEKMYFSIRGIHNFEYVPFKQESMVGEFNNDTKLVSGQEYKVSYWLQPSLHDLRRSFFSSSKAAQELLIKIEKCSKALDYKCFSDLSDSSLNDYMRAVHDNFSGGEHSMSLEYFSTPSMFASLVKCFKKGTPRSIEPRVTSKNDVNLMHYGLDMQLNDTWKPKWGNKVDDFRCGMSITEKKVDGAWKVIEAKLRFYQAQYM